METSVLLGFDRHQYPLRSPIHKRRKRDTSSRNAPLVITDKSIHAPVVSIEDMNIAGNLARPLLDNSHLKLRSHLAQGAVAKRRPPSKISSTVFKENDKNSNNIAKNIPPALPKHIAEDRKNLENIRPVVPGRRKVKTPTKGLLSDDSDASSGLFGSHRSEGNIATEVDHNPRGAGGIMLIASKPLQDSASNSVSTNLGSQPDLLGSTSSLDDSMTPMPHTIRCYTWNTDQVGQWLYDIGLPHLVILFIQNNINGKALLLLDSARIKQMGIATKDKSILKKRLKEIRTAYDKERKQLEKDQKSKSPVTKKKAKSLFARF